MQNVGYNKATNIRVIKLVLRETGTYNPQYSRPYETMMDGQTLSHIVNQVMSSTTKEVTPSLMQGLSGAFIKPQATPGGEIGIVNSWSERRCRFFLHVECDTGVAGTITQYIQGWTNHLGVSDRGFGKAHADPDMEFYVNSIVATKRVEMWTPTGNQIQETIIENAHLLQANQFTSMYQPNQQRMIRPQDVFVNIALEELQPDFGSGRGEVGAGNVYDARTTLQAEAQKSRRRNGMPGTYAASIMDSYRIATGTGTDFNMSESSILETARNQVVESQASTDPFISSMTNIIGTIATNKFRMRDLLALDNNTQYVTNLSIAGNVQQRTRVHQTGDTQHWQGSDRVTQAASLLSQAVPSLMMDLLISNLTFKSSNHDGMGGQPLTHILDARSYTNLDLQRNLSMFKHRFEREILSDVTIGNSCSYMLEMEVNMQGDSWIRIALDSPNMVEFNVPSFCDSLIVPVLTTDPHSAMNIAHDFSALNNGIKEAFGNYQDMSQTQINTLV